MDKEIYNQKKQVFQNVLDTEVLPFLKRSNEKRLEIQKQTRMKAIAIIIAIITIGLIDFDIFLVYLLFGEGLFPLLTFVLILCIFERANKKFEIEIKEQLMHKLCSCFDGLNWRYEKDSIYHAVFKKAGVAYNAKKARYDDQFKGYYNGVYFRIIEAEYEFADIQLLSEKCVKDFQGIILKIPMNKKFSGHTIVNTRDCCHPLPSWNLKKTELEDVIFKIKYSVYTNNELEARYLLTTAFMEKLNNMSKIFGASCIVCAFYNKELLLALNKSRDMFSLFSDFSEPFYYRGQFDGFFEEIVAIYDLIDYFKLTEEAIL